MTKTDNRHPAPSGPKVTPQESRRSDPSRWASGSAIAFGVLIVISGATTGHPPDPDQPVAAIARWYAAHRVGTFVMELLLAIAAGLLLWFAADAYRVARARAGRTSTAAVSFLTSSSAFAALLVTGGWPQLALAVTVGRGTTPAADPSVRLLSDMTWLHWPGQTLLLVAAATSLAVLLRDGSLGRKWIAWPTTASAIGCAIGGAATFFPSVSGKENPLGLLGYLGFVLFGISVLLCGVTTPRRDKRPTPYG